MKHATSHIVAGSVFTLLAAAATLGTMGVGAFGLAVGIVVAHGVWVARGPSVFVHRNRLLTAYAAGLVVMAAHFAEEYLTGFQRAFPPLIGGESWSDTRFVAFNAAWYGVFVLAAAGIYFRAELAYLVAWFFGLVAGIGNGAGHLLLSLSEGRYFPGTVTAPLCLVAGILIVRALVHGDPAPTARLEPGAASTQP